MTRKLETFNRSDLEEHLSREFSELGKEKISSAVETIINTIVESVALDNKVEIRGFGTFSKKFIRPRKFINPKTKAVSYIGETATLHFKPSKSLIQD